MGWNERNTYREITEAINDLTREIGEINNHISSIRSAINLQTQYLELITRKYNKKLFKRYFGKKK
jgi:methyl-accepting chemotaxis protein